MVQRTRVTGYDDTQGAWRAFRRLGGGCSFDGAGRAVTFRNPQSAAAFAVEHPSWTTSIAQVIGVGLMLTGVIEVSPAQM